MQADFTINGRPSSEFSCRMVSDWTVKTALSQTFLQAGKDTTFRTFGTAIGLKDVMFTLDFFGRNPRQAELHRSAFSAELLRLDVIELYMPDGFLYRVSPVSLGEKEEITNDGAMLTCSYTLRGLQCDPLQQHQGVTAEFFAGGTHPAMACRLTVTTGSAVSRYTMAGITWDSVQQGDVLVIDGLNKRVTKNGANAILETDLVDWPTLAPGENRLQCIDPLTVEYYPIYI